MAMPGARYAYRPLPGDLPIGSSSLCTSSMPRRLVRMKKSPQGVPCRNARSSVNALPTCSMRSALSRILPRRGSASRHQKNRFNRFLSGVFPMNTASQQGVKGLDLGTSRIVLATLNGEEVDFSPQLNAFVDIPYSKMTEQMLAREQIMHRVEGDHIYAYGNRADE